jgi:hypothetical protein
MVCPDGVDLFNLFRECRRFVYEQLNEFVWGRLAGQEFKLLVDRTSPSENYTGCNLQEAIRRNRELMRNLSSQGMDTYDNGPHWIQVCQEPFSYA